MGIKRKEKQLFSKQYVYQMSSIEVEALLEHNLEVSSFYGDN